MLPAGSSWAKGDTFSPYIEHFPNGKIDWDNGFFYGTGDGYPHLNDGSKARALKVAQAGALSAILQVAYRLRVDDQRLLADLENEKASIHISAFVHYEPFKREFVTEGDQPFFRVTYRAPINGVNGLTGRLFSHFKSRPLTFQDFPGSGFSENDGSALWLILDARSLEQNRTVQPALFPKIVTEDGKIVYEFSKVNEDALIKRGMARYVVTDKNRDDLLSWAEQIPMARFMTIISPSIAQAAEKNKRKKRERYIIKDVEQVRGIMKTDLVISESDAKSINAEDASSQILGNCRVIVIVSSSIGGIEGRFIDYLAFDR